MAVGTHHGEALKIHMSSLVASIVTSLYSHSNLNLTLTMLDLIALLKHFFCSSPMMRPNKLDCLSLVKANICYCSRRLSEWSITPLGQTPGLTRKNKTSIERPAWGKRSSWFVFFTDILSMYPTVFVRDMTFQASLIFVRKLNKIGALFH
jgi:hypothetical protein